MRKYGYIRYHVVSSICLIIKSIMQNKMGACVNNFIHNGYGKISSLIDESYSHLINLLRKTLIPMFDSLDHLIWERSSSTNFSVKDACLFF